MLTLLLSATRLQWHQSHHACVACKMHHCDQLDRYHTFELAIRFVTGMGLFKAGMSLFNAVCRLVIRMTVCISNLSHIVR
jgi:hypothetical protein